MPNALIQLNEKQKEAATVCDRNVRVVAGAGSGKTRMLMGRIAYLIEEIGEDPSHIMAITFTNKAAREMKERLEKMLPDQAGRVWISTIHRLCVRILREDAQSLGYPKSFTILDADDQRSLISRFLKEKHYDRKTVRPAAVASAISGWKTKGISPARAAAGAYADQTQEAASRIYGDYEREKQELLAMDFDDLLIEADRLLKQDQKVREKWQKRFDYLHVDEFQDIDPLQYDIIRNLTRKDAMLCVVGDPDQTIYTWRGAAMRILLHFDQDFSPCHTVILDQNYRSTPTILNASNALIARNRNRIKKNLYSEQKDLDPIRLYAGDTMEQEANYVALNIRKLQLKEKIPYSEMAVLYRSNYLSLYLEKALRHYAIPYQIYGGTRFYERKEVKDVLAYLQLLEEPDPSDPDQRSLDLSIERIINVPKRAIGAATVDKLRDEAASKGQSLLKTLQNPETLNPAPARKLKKFYQLIMDLREQADGLVLPELVDLILQETGYQAMLEEAKEEDRLENVLEIARDMESQMRENPDLTLDDYFQNVALLTNTAEESTDGVSLMTVHAAKGTEFDAVFIASFNEDIFPSARALQDSAGKALEEERRLMYVAMTRARKHLFITWNTDRPYYGQSYRTVSRFLTEIPQEYTESEGTPGRTESSSASGQNRSLLEKNVLSARKSGRPVRYRPGMLVKHSVFGEGVIISADGSRLKVAFQEPARVQTISADYKGLEVLGRES